MSSGTARGLRALAIGLAIAAFVAVHGIIFHIVSARLALGGAAVIAFAALVVAAHVGLLGGAFARLHGRSPPD